MGLYVSGYEGPSTAMTPCKVAANKNSAPSSDGVAAWNDLNTIRIADTLAYEHPI